MVRRRHSPNEVVPTIVPSHTTKKRQSLLFVPWRAHMVIYRRATTTVDSPVSTQPTITTTVPGRRYMAHSKSRRREKPHSSKAQASGLANKTLAFDNRGKKRGDARRSRKTRRGTCGKKGRVCVYILFLTMYICVCVWKSNSALSPLFPDPSAPCPPARCVSPDSSFPYLHAIDHGLRQSLFDGGGGSTKVAHAGADDDFWKRGSPGVDPHPVHGGRGNRVYEWLASKVRVCQFFFLWSKSKGWWWRCQLGSRSL